MRERTGDTARALAVVARTPALARAESAFGATCAAEAAFTVGLGLVAFDDGGTAAVGLVAALRLVPSGLLAPVAGTVADRRPRDRVLGASSVLVAASLAASAAVLALGGTTVAVYALALVATIALTPYRAAHSALLPSLCRTSDELAASNIVRALVESVAVVVGPLAAAGLAAAVGLWPILAAAALAAAVAGALVVRLPYDRSPGRTGGGTVAGLRAALGDGDARALILLASAQTFLRGALGVFTVVLALDTFDRGDAAAGVLQAAVGLGAVAGSIGAARLVGTRHLAAWFGAAVAGWGLPVAVLGLAPGYGTGLGLLLLVGAANAVLDVGLFTMLGRLVPDEVMARVFGVFESVVAVTVAAGSLAAAATIEAAGIEVAMVVLGSVPPAAAALGWRRLRRIDATLDVRQRELDVLQRVPMLRALPVAAIEHLARRVDVVAVPAGTVVVAEGGAGDRYFVVAAGSVAVRDRRRVRRLGPGEGFGEVALLRGSVRTATVTAATDAELYVLDRDDFVAAVTGSPPASAAASATMARWAGARRSSG